MEIEESAIYIHQTNSSILMPLNASQAKPISTKGREQMKRSPLRLCKVQQCPQLLLFASRLVAQNQNLVLVGDWSSGLGNGQLWNQAFPSQLMVLYYAKNMMRDQQMLGTCSEATFYCWHQWPISSFIWDTAGTTSTPIQMYFQYGVVNIHFLGYVGAFSGTPSFLSNVKILPDILILQLIDKINVCFVYWICTNHFSR